MAFLSPVPKLYFTDSNGDPLVGGKLWTYQSGTSTPAATYTTFTGDVANANPVILDSRGEALVFLDSTEIYRFYLTDANDVPVWASPVDGINGNSATSGNVLQNIPTAQWAAIINGTSTYDCTTGIQTTIDDLNALYNGGTYGGGAGTCYLPAGRYEYTGMIRKKGVNLLGDGESNTILALKGSTSTGMKTPAAGTMDPADVVSNVDTRGIQFISGESAPVSQVQWNLIGFTYHNFYDCTVEWFGGCNGATMTGATLAGSGGPANWYNNFYNINWLRLASRPAGGIAAQLGDTAIGLEQITTYNFRGGRVSGAGDGTGFQIRGTGNMFDGVVFEALDVGIEYGSTSTRGATGNTEIGCYYEGNTINRRFRANAENTMVVGGFVTGGTDDDLSTSTHKVTPGYYQAYLPNAAANKWEVSMTNGANYRPTFAGSTTPGIDIKNSAGNYMTIMNLAASSNSWSWLQVYALNRTTLLYEAGEAGMRPGADNTMSNGSASFRWSVIYAGTGTINTSDATEKTVGRPMNAKERAVAQAIKSKVVIYKLKNSVTDKGKSARLHTGYMAQDVRDCFAAQGLDPYDYGINCMDQLDDGSIRLGLRYDELHAFLNGA